MKALRFSVAVVLLLSLVICMAIPAGAETLQNAGDAKTSFTFIAFEMETVNSSGNATQFYNKGDTVTLNIALFGITDGAKTQLTTPKVKIIIDSDDGTSVTDTVEMTNGLAAYTFTAMNVAGWQRIRLRALDASGNDLTGGSIKEYSGGITVDKDNVGTSISKPADFESWWAQVIEEELDTCPPEVIRIEQLPSDYNYIYRVYVTAPTLKDSEHQFLKSGDTYVSFHLVFSKTATKGSLGISATYQGYNMSTGGYWSTPGKIVLSVNAHSTTLGETHTYDELTDWELGSSGKYGWDATRTKDRDTHYFKYMLLRDLQAIRFAQKCFGPEGYNKVVDGIDLSQFRGLWDNETVHVSGSSQGGFQATAMAALCPEVTSCSTSMTWLCDVAGNYVNGRVKSSFRPVRAQNTDGRYGLDYFDSTFFATMIDCPYTLEVVGTGDVVAPVSGILALYNNLDVPEKSIKFTQGRDHMTDKGIWQYHTYFGDANESYGETKEGGVTVWKLEDSALKITGVNTLTAELMAENGWNDIKSKVQTIHLKGFTSVAAGALDLTGSNVYAIGINSSTMTLSSGAIMLGSNNIDLATPASSAASSYSATGITKRTLVDGRYYVALSADSKTLSVCVFYGELNGTMFNTEATANATTITTLEIKGNPFCIGDIATTVGKLTACKTILFDAGAETLTPVVSAWYGMFGKIDALTTVAHISDWSSPSYTDGVVDLRGFKHLYATSGDKALQGLFYDCQGITSVIMPDALYLYNGTTTVKDSKGNPIELSGATYYIQFSGCTALKSIKWNQPLGSIAEGSLYNCSSLTSIIAPSISEDFFVFMGTGAYINGLTSTGAFTIATEDSTVLGKLDNSSLNGFYVLSGDVLKIYRYATAKAFGQPGSDSFATIATTIDGSAVREIRMIGSLNTYVGSISNATFKAMPNLETILMDSRMDLIASYFCISASGSKLSTFAHVTFDDVTNEITGEYEQNAIDLRGFKYIYTSTAARYKLNTSFAVNTKAQKLYLPTSLILANTTKTPTLVDGSQVDCAAVIGSSAFSGNASLTHVVIPATVSTIEANAFKDCVLLQTIDFGGVTSDIAIDSTAFTNVASSTAKKYATANLPDAAQTAIMAAALGDITTVRALGSATVAPSLSAEGHAVRTEGYTGLRSIFAFDSSVIETNKANGLSLVEYGALLIAQKNFEPYCNNDEYTLYKLGASGSVKVKYVPVYKMVGGTQKGVNRYLSVEDGIYTYCVTLTGIDSGNYTDDVYTCAYVKWVDASGNEYFEFVHYVDTLGQDARSLYDVTAAAYKMGIVNSTLAPDFDSIIWPVLEKGAVTIGGFQYLNVPYYSYKWYANKEYTTPVTNVNASLNYYPGDDTPTESGIVWTLIQYGDEYIATYRLAEGADPMSLPRQTYVAAGDGYTVFQPFDYRFNGAKNGKNYAVLDTLSPTLPAANAKLVKTLVIDSGITGANTYSLAYMPYVSTVVLPSDFDSIVAGAFHGCSALKNVFQAGTAALENTVDLSFVASMTSLSWAFTDCYAIENIKLPAAIAPSDTYGAFRNCNMLERVWIDGTDMPEYGTIDLSSIATLKINTDMFTNVYLINTLICPDNTSFTRADVLYKAVVNTGRDNPFNADINLNIVFNENSAAKTAIDAQLTVTDKPTVFIGLNGKVVTFEGDVEVDIGGLH